MPMAPERAAGCSSGNGIAARRPKDERRGLGEGLDCGVALQCRVSPADNAWRPRAHIEYGVRQTRSYEVRTDLQAMECLQACVQLTKAHLNTPPPQNAKIAAQKPSRCDP